MMKQYDFSLKCNAVWSSDAIAYRCNTCAYNPCMSLCAECFQNSNHQGHDFNRFFSQAGGACDCGNADVLRESGFCARHGPNAKRPPAPSDNIVSLAEFMIPKLFVRLFLYFRGWLFFEETSRHVDFSLDWRSRSAPPVKYSFDCLLDELVFWMIRLIFPQSIINLCLSMLSHADYRDWFACRFFSLYACVAEIMVDLAKSEGNATIYAVSSRVIHISVQVLLSFDSFFCGLRLHGHVISAHLMERGALSRL
ncbi:unnamed protein product [Toxocara canis]|uniref:E3 ubiquitin-protein ligase n=1 Tax=Toxocara canis TaxID=6265 RepID=A0A183TZ22_TOXCA|nr:unnamed protein product [Toxocara canis]